MRRQQLSSVRNKTNNVLKPFLVIDAVIIGYCFYAGIVAKQWFAVFGACALSIMIIAITAIIFRERNSIVFWEMEVDNEKITFYTSTNKEIEFFYSYCVDIGMSYTIRNSDVMDGIIYLSKKSLSREQKDFLSQNDLTVSEWKKINMPILGDEIFMIGYNPDSFRELKNNLPEPLRSRLVEDENRCMTEYKAYLQRKRDLLSWSRDGRTDIKEPHKKRNHN